MGACGSSLRWLSLWSHHADNRNISSTFGSRAGPSGEEEITYRLPSARSIHIPPLFALVIGINEYANIQGLKGAVSDAEEMKKYLREVLHVPKDHIRTLVNHEATREAIIKAFKNLRADRRIKYGDAIVIFYAGHGGELPTPRGWGSKSKIQCLLPQDCNASKDANVIPDRTIGALIEDIAKVKGDNITVIFDSCHSGSGTRDRSYRPRAVELDISIPENLDRDIWGSRDGSPADGYAHHGYRSHVLLAACGEQETTNEDNEGGYFTKALLGILREYADKNLTYTKLHERVRSKLKNQFGQTQTPRCEGRNQHRVIFDAKVPVGGQVFYPVEARTGKCVIYAGRAHGVSSRIGFTLYTKELKPVAAVSVDDNSVIEDFKTTVATSVHLGDASLAKLTRVGKLSLYLTPGGRHSVLKQILQNMAAPNFQVVGKRQRAKLEVALENSVATFEILDPRVNRLGLTKLPRKATRDRIAHVLDAAAHYFWFLDVENANTRTNTSRAVAVNFYLLKTENDEWGLPQLVQDGPGFWKSDQNNSGVIDFVVHPTGKYGVEIKNRTPRDLYLNAFLFNNSSLKIAPYYAQQTSGNPEPPLKKGETLTIGYGDGARPPFSYSLQEGQDVDVGYLKIFFATKPIDLSHIEQTSPFTDIYPPPQENRREGGPDSAPRTADDVRVDDIWFTTLIPVVQRRN